MRGIPRWRRKFKTTDFSVAAFFHKDTREWSWEFSLFSFVYSWAGPRYSRKSFFWPHNTGLFYFRILRAQRAIRFDIFYIGCLLQWYQHKKWEKKKQICPITGHIKLLGNESC